jgi:hypothetical protein
MRSSFLALAAALLLAPAAHALPVSFSGGTALTIVGGYSQSNPLAAQFGITNTSGQDLTLGLERQIISAVPGSENNFCFGTGCYPPTVSIAPLPITLPAGATDNTFVGDYTPNNYAGVTRIRYAFYDVNGAGVAADTAYVTVTYDASQRVAGLAADLAASTLLGAPAPNPAVAGAEVRFSLDAAAPKGATAAPLERSHVKRLVPASAVINRPNSPTRLAGALAVWGVHQLLPIRALFPQRLVSQRLASPQACMAANSSIPKAPRALCVAWLSNRLP